MSACCLYLVLWCWCLCILFVFVWGLLCCLFYVFDLIGCWVLLFCALLCGCFCCVIWFWLGNDLTVYFLIVGCLKNVIINDITINLQLWISLFALIDLVLFGYLIVWLIDCFDFSTAGFGCLVLLCWLFCSCYDCGFTLCFVDLDWFCTFDLLDVLYFTGFEFVVFCVCVVLGFAYGGLHLMWLLFIYGLTCCSFVCCFIVFGFGVVWYLLSTWFVFDWFVLVCCFVLGVACYPFSWVCWWGVVLICVIWLVWVVSLGFGCLWFCFCFCIGWVVCVCLGVVHYGCCFDLTLLEIVLLIWLDFCFVVFIWELLGFTVGCLLCFDGWFMF